MIKLGQYVFIATLIVALTDAANLQRVRRGSSECACELTEWPVCGKDAQQYNNMCDLECAGVELDYEGPCSTRRKRSFFEYEDCNCPKVHLPVCGVDEHTYPSQCVRRCAIVGYPRPLPPLRYVSNDRGYPTMTNRCYCIVVSYIGVGFAKFGECDE